MVYGVTLSPKASWFESPWENPFLYDSLDSKLVLACWGVKQSSAIPDEEAVESLANSWLLLIKVLSLRPQLSVSISLQYDKVGEGVYFHFKKKTII